MGPSGERSEEPLPPGSSAGISGALAWHVVGADAGWSVELPHPGDAYESRSPFGLRFRFQVEDLCIFVLASDQRPPVAEPPRQPVGYPLGPDRPVSHSRTDAVDWSVVVDPDHESAQSGTEGEASRLDAWLGPFLTDSLLWPVGIVLGTALALFGSAILLLAFERNAFAWVALLALLFATGDGLRADLRRRRIGPGGVVILLVWLFAILGAVAGSQLGLF